MEVVVHVFDPLAGIFFCFARDRQVVVFGSHGGLLGKAGGFDSNREKTLPNPMRILRGGVACIGEHRCFYNFILDIDHHLGGFPVEILLFDSSSESAKVWSGIANSHHLRVEINPIWPGLERVSDTAILVLDQSAFPGSFASAVAAIANQRPHQVVIATGVGLTVKQVTEVMRAGVDFVFEKPLNPLLVNCSFEDILETARRLGADRQEYETLQGLFDKLTTRERDVLDYVLEGVPNKKTAEELSVSVRTIEARRAKVYDKTQSTCVVELVRKVDRLARLARVFEVKEPAIKHPLSEEGSLIKKHLTTRPLESRSVAGVSALRSGVNRLQQRTVSGAVYPATPK